MDDTQGALHIDSTLFFGNKATTFGGDVFHGQGSMQVKNTNSSQSFASDGGAFAVFGYVSTKVELRR